MRAVLSERYGPPETLRLADVERPVPEDGQVLVRVHATTVNRSDCAWRAGDHPLLRLVGGLRRPKWHVLGSELAGTVEGVGAGVDGFAVGDEVFGVKNYLREGFGAHAEYVCIRAAGALARKPAGMSFEDAAAVADGGLNALTSLRRVALGAGQHILVYGASGSIGTAAVQLARHLGAEVTGVCSSRNVDIVRSLGATEVIDYTREDFTGNGRRYDVIFDAVGKHSFRRCRGSLRPGGMYIATDRLVNALLALVTSRTGGRRVVFPIPQYTSENLRYLTGLIEAGHYRAVVDRVYRLEDVVEATRYVETHHKTGNVVLTVAGDPAAGPV